MRGQNHAGLGLAKDIQVWRESIETVRVNNQPSLVDSQQFVYQFRDSFNCRKAWTQYYAAFPFCERENAVNRCRAEITGYALRERLGHLFGELGFEYRIQRSRGSNSHEAGTHARGSSSGHCRRTGLSRRPSHNK
jgi:hypothetical protein